MKAWLLLAGCGFIPGMDSLALELCVQGISDAERAQFLVDVSLVVYPRREK